MKRKKTLKNKINSIIRVLSINISSDNSYAKLLALSKDILFKVSTSGQFERQDDKQTTGI